MGSQNFGNNNFNLEPVFLKFTTHDLITCWLSLGYQN